MKTHNPGNERLKREYFDYLREARRRNDASIDVVASALYQFETYTRFRDFKRFHVQQAKGFKAHLAKSISERTGKPLSKATLLSTLNALKAFFFWLAGRPGYKQALSYSDSDYFNLSEKETRIAQAHREQRVPTVDEIKRVLAAMPAETEIDRRDRALIAFALMTGARDGAMASFKLKHVDLGEGKVNQDGREVNTKYSKTFTTYFLPMGDDVLEIFAGWVNHLLREKQWGPDDPLFPKTRIVVGRSRHFEANGVERAHWRDAGPIRKVFARAFGLAKLPYANPHSIRNTLALLGELNCPTYEAFKAFSQNIGHDKVLTTLMNYGKVTERRQAEIIRGLNMSPTDDKTDRIAKMVAQMIRSAEAMR